jgi:hypothetical protein
MQQLMSRFGGYSMILGKGKASDSLLPEDQSVDNLLDNYAKEIIPNHFMVSSYDAKPTWMGSLKTLPMFEFKRSSANDIIDRIVAVSWLKFQGCANGIAQCQSN